MRGSVLTDPNSHSPSIHSRQSHSVSRNLTSRCASVPPAPGAAKQPISPLNPTTPIPLAAQVTPDPVTDSA